MKSLTLRLIQKESSSMAKKVTKKPAKRAKSIAAKAPKAAKKPQVPRMKLTKGQIRKRNALRKSLGNKIADQAFAKWMKAEKSAAANKAPTKDAVAEKIARALKRVAGEKLNFGTYGYSVQPSDLHPRTIPLFNFAEMRNAQRKKPSSVLEPGCTTLLVAGARKPRESLIVPIGL